MVKEVLYRDSMGFRQHGNIQEFEIDRFFDDDHRDSSGRRGYGFARPIGQPRGTRGIFFSAASGYPWMKADNIKKLHFLPAFTESPTMLGNHSRVLTPVPGTRIIGVIGEGRKGTEIVAWSAPESYAEGIKECEKYLEHEKERLERNPTFRCLEISRYAGGKEYQRRNPVFEGTKKQFEERFPLGLFVRIAGRSDPLVSDTIGDVEYIRWFERELSGEDEWERCNDPRRMRFQLTQTAAYRLLQFDSIRRADDPVAWFSLDHPEKLVARGNYRQGNQKFVYFPATEDYLETEFTGDQAEILWKLGEFMAQVQEADAEATRRPLGK